MKLRNDLAIVLAVVAGSTASFTAWHQSARLSTSNLKLAAASERGEGEELRYDQPDAAAAYWAMLHSTPPGKSAAELNLAAVAAIKQSEADRGGGPNLPNLRIESWGAGNFGGRLRGIVIKPDDPDQMLVGSVGGGIWKSIDGGASWAPADDFLPVLAVGSMLQDPDDNNRVFAGTGEGFFNFDAAQGSGIFVTTDFGDTWNLLAGTDNPNFFFVNRLVAIPGTNKLLASTSTGIWGTDDFTAVSPLWTERSGFVTDGRGFVDLKLDPSTATPSARIYAYHFGGAEATRRVWRSSNDGASFTQLGAAEGIPTTNIRRMEIGVGTDGVVYLSVANASDATRGLWRAPAGGTTFTQAASATAYIERQGWYDLIAGVKPGDSNTVLLGAVDVYTTANAGATITKKTFWNPGPGQYPQDYVHADIHVVTFQPGSPNTVFIGCDGGIFKSTDGGENFTELNHDLRVAQYYGIAAHPNGDEVIGGTQDNGSHLFVDNNPIWLQWFGGDGGYCAWDQQQTQHLYGSTPAGGLFGSNDGGSSSAAITLPSTAGALFINPFTLDPNNGNRMIVGTNRVYYSANIRNLASATFSDDSGSLGSSLSATTISPHSGTTAFAGTVAGRIYRTTTLGTPTAWPQVQNAAMLGSEVTWIHVDPHDGTGNTVYATLADYATDRVWKSTNGGSSWFSIHGDLPNIPMFTVVVDPVDPNRLWLGSELGLWTTDSNGGGPFHWERYDFGLPWVRVMQLIWATDDVLWAGTHGRSIFKISRSPGVATLGAVDDSAGGCDADGFLDATETAAVPVTITNRGGQTMANVSVALSSTYPGLSILTGATSYGSISPGAAVANTFSLSLASVAQCRDQAPITVTITDDDGTTTQTVRLFVGADAEPGPLTEDAEDADTAFTHVATVGADDWARVTTAAHTGARSWFAADIGSFAEKSLVSPWVEIGNTGTAQLSFWLRYNMEGDASQYWDGTVLELRVFGTEEWIDIGLASTVPYDGRLFSNNTIPGRLAWSGTQLTWRNAVVDLGTTYQGERVQFRFRVVCDGGANNVGFWVDDISLTNATWPGCDTVGSCNFVFADGFETGNTAAWTITVP